MNILRSIPTLTICFFALLTIFSIPPHCIAGGNEPESVSLFIFGTGCIYNNNEKIGKPVTDADLKSHYGAGLALGYTITHKLSLEFTAGDILGRFSKHNSLSSGNVQSNIYHLGFLYHTIPADRILPYVGAGLGWISHIPAAHELDNIHDPLINYGLGMKFHISQGVTFRWDARRIIVYIRKSNDIKNIIIANFGLSFTFDSKKTKEKCMRPADTLQPEPRATRSLLKNNRTHASKLSID